VKEGDQVSKGQLLAVLNTTDINAQLSQANQAVEKATRDAKRVKNLFADTAATLEQVQNVQTQLDVAKENQRLAQFTLEYAQIRAPQSGVINKKIGNEGEIIGGGSPVLIMNGNGSADWVVRFGATDKDWSMLSKGDAAVINLDAYPSETFSGVITKKNEWADPVSNTYEMEVKINPGKEKLAAGLFATLHLRPAKSKKSTPLVQLPIEALAEADEKNGFVYTVNPDGKTVRRIPVQIAYLLKDKVAIRSGLEGIREVITDGVSYLTPNSKVTVAK
jgi:RND family efflux transporter MFP subunit